MNVKELQEALRLVEQMYAAGGAQKQASEVHGLVSALDPHGGKSVEDFVREMGALLDSKPAAKRSVIGFDEAIVGRHTAALLDAATDRSKFDAAFSAVKADKAVKIAEMGEIANRFKNTPSGASHRYSHASKTAAADFIFDTYIERAQFESKMSAIERMTRWATR